VSTQTRFLGSDRIVSVASLPDETAEMCPYPAYTDMGAVAAAPQQGGGGAILSPQSTITPHAGLAEGGHNIRSRAGTFDEKSVRYIHDPNPAFSAIAVNAENDMLVIVDENNDTLLEYSRRDNTRPGARPTMPRRVVGGLATYMEMPCAVYIDPKTLQSFVLNNDTQNWMPVFSREAKGNAKPDRVLATPHGTWGIAADETRQEVYLTVQGPSAVVVYRKQAQGIEAPLRIIQGNSTELADPQGIAVDVKNDLLVVVNHGARRVSLAAPAPMRPPDQWRRAWEEGAARAGMHGFTPLTAGRGRGQGAEGAEGGQGGQTYGKFEMPSINIFARGVNGDTAELAASRGGP
jgi:hypothetical protein